jgi:hypothetical protein
MQVAMPQIVAKITIEVTIMPASAPVDSVIDLEGDIGMLVEVPAAEMEVVLAIGTIIVLLAEEVATGWAAMLTVHANAGPASL